MSDIDAPFEEAFANVFLPRLLATMTRYLGQEILTGALSDQDADIRAAAFKLAASSAAGNPAAIEPLIPSLTDSTETIRRAAYQAIVSMREAAAPPLIARLKDPNPALRAAVVDVLREVGGRAAIDAVVAALSDPATQVRDAAIISISSLTYDAKLESLQLAVEPLLRIATGDPDAATRRHAVEVLPRLRDPRSIEPLIAILEGADASLRATAGAALQELTGQRFGLNAKKWRQWLAKTRQ
jgi:HEAT repeat protein